MIDFTGRRFGRLTVLAEAERPMPLVRALLCRCDCGAEKVVRVTNLCSGNTVSCGCFGHERAFQRNREHGHTVGRKWSAEYLAWIRMKQRCYNPKCDSYPRYGGRGITVAPEWIDDFPKFLAHVGPKPTKPHSLDRIDNEKGYRPGNVKWSTGTEQQQNRTSTRMVLFNGANVPITRLAKQCGIEADVLFRRIQLGWSVEKAMTTPKRQLTRRAALSHSSNPI